MRDRVAPPRLPLGLLPLGLLLLGLSLLATGCPRTGVQLPPESVENTMTSPSLNDLPPKLGAKVPFPATEPVVYKTPQGVTVWLIERPLVPIVSATLVVPRGSADDAVGKAGLAHLTASMMDEGAGSRDAVAISSDIDHLGASLWSAAGVDGSRVSLTILHKHLAAGFEIFADVIARPTFAQSDFDRTAGLWLDGLKKRPDNPQRVARVVRGATMYGLDSPYGHPTTGTLKSAAGVKLEDLKQFYRSHWRPDEAFLVVAGAINRAELETLVEKHLATWQAAGEAPPRAKASPIAKDRPAWVLVDRPDAPQSVITVAAPGTSASGEHMAELELVNVALGGSFTSRLNQNLREDNNWTYGASSAFLETRHRGLFVAQSSVLTEATGKALKEMLGEIDKLKSTGLTDDEVLKAQARDLTDTIETHETTDSLVGRLGSLATLGLRPTHDVMASRTRQAANLKGLNVIAAADLPARAAQTIFVVGPAATVEADVQKALGLGAPLRLDPEGQPVD